MRIGAPQAAEAVVIGIGATAAMDIVGEVLRRTRGVRPLDYALVGRWLGHMREGRFAHDSIGAAEPVPGERAIGWVAHYAIGTCFAAALVAIDPGWLEEPTPWPALAMGVGTVAAPWFIMQPAFGLGWAAAKAPDPMLARARSLRTHAVYGLGLWLSGSVVRGLREALRAAR